MKNTMNILSRVVLIGFICALFSLGYTTEAKAATCLVHIGAGTNMGTTDPQPCNANNPYTYNQGEVINITATPNEGFIFRYWRSSNGGTFDDANSASTRYTVPNVDSDDVVAIFNTAPTITLDPNNGSESTSTVMTGTDRKLASLPAYPEWTGHNCIGWFTQRSGGDQVTENTEFTTDTTIFAHWENATAAPSITTTSLPNGTVGEAYSQQLEASGGSGALSWEITSGTPPHFSLSPSGVLSGTPDSVGEYTFTVKVTDALNRSDTKNLTITFDPAAVTHTVTFNPNGTGATVNPTSGTTGTDGKLTSLPTPRWTGHSFTGWYTLATGGEEVTTNTVFSGNRTIYAHWSDSNTVNVNVTFKVKNGSWNDGTRANKTKNLWRYENQDLALQLTAADIPGVGNNPDSGYRAGSWDVEPPIGTNLSNESRNLTYTYTYAGSGSSGSKKSDDSDHHEESSSPAPEKPSWTPAQAAATIAAQKAQKQQAAATQLASIQTMLRTKTSDRAGTGRNVIDLDMTKVDILDPATVNLLLLNNRFAFNVKISVPGGLTTTIMIPANFNFRPFIKADGTMNIHEVLWSIVKSRIKKATPKGSLYMIR